MTQISPGPSFDLSEDRYLILARRAVTYCLLLMVILLACFALFGDVMLQALHAGKSLAYLNEIVSWLKIKDSRFEEFPFFAGQISGLVFRSGALITLSLLILSLLQWRYPKVITDFVNEQSHPLNLAIFRIFFFLALLLNINEERILWYSNLPQDLQVAPPGWEAVLYVLPINPALAKAGIWLLHLFALTALAGLFSRTSAWMTAILGIYVLGIPQMYGKLNHYHHLIWFAMLLGSSRCGDTLSLDALIRVWREAKHRMPAMPAPSRGYAFPLKMTWLLMGLIYFFPGFWKFSFSGFEWAFSENLKYKMYASWANFGADPPFFRLDLYPALYQASAFLTIVIELAFISLVLSHGWRIVAFAAGLLFHNMTRLFMFISFSSLQLCYVALLDVHRILRFVGSRLFPDPLTFVFNDALVLHRRIAAGIRTIDIFNRIDYQVDDQLKSLTVITPDERLLAGSRVALKLTCRLPLLWFILPLLFFSTLVSSVSNVTGINPSKRLAFPILLNANRKTHIWTGLALFTLNALCGLLLIDSWPVGTYPTFATQGSPTMTSMTLALQNPDNARIKEISLTASQSSRDAFAGERLRILVERILATRDQDLKKKRARALWNTLVVADSTLQASEVIVYQVQVALEPGASGRELSRKEVFSFMP